MNCIKCDGWFELGCKTDGFGITISDESMFPNPHSFGENKIKIGNCEFDLSTVPETLEENFENCNIEPTQDDSQTIEFNFDMELYSGDNLIETVGHVCSIPAYFEIYSKSTLSKVAENSFSGGVTQNTETSSLASLFTLGMYHSDAFDEIINEDNKIIIGKPIYLRISISKMPSYLEYQVVKCFVHPPDNTDKKIEILNKSQCGFDIFNVEKIQNDDHYQFNFLSFTFDGEEAFDMNCDILVCVKKDEAHCGPIQSTCDDGYSIITTSTD